MQEGEIMDTMQKQLQDALQQLCSELHDIVVDHISLATIIQNHGATTSIDLVTMEGNDQ